MAGYLTEDGLALISVRDLTGERLWNSAEVRRRASLP